MNETTDKSKQDLSRHNKAEDCNLTNKAIEVCFKPKGSFPRSSSLNVKNVVDQRSYLPIDLSCVEIETELFMVG